MGKNKVNDILFGEKKRFKDFEYQTAGGQHVTVRMYYPDVKDKGWLLGMEKYTEKPETLFVDVLMRADIRDPEDNERLFDSTMRDSIAASDQDLFVKMAGDWMGLVTRVDAEEAVKN